MVVVNILKRTPQDLLYLLDLAFFVRCFLDVGDHTADYPDKHIQHDQAGDHHVDHENTPHCFGRAWSVKERLRRSGYVIQERSGEEEVKESVGHGTKLVDLGC